MCIMTDIFVITSTCDQCLLLHLLTETFIHKYQPSAIK